MIVRSWLHASAPGLEFVIGMLLHVQETFVFGGVWGGFASPRFPSSCSRKRSSLEGFGELAALQASMPRQKRFALAFQHFIHHPRCPCGAYAGAGAFAGTI